MSNEFTEEWADEGIPTLRPITMLPAEFFDDLVKELDEEDDER